MTILYIIAVAAVWLLPILLSLCIVYDGGELRVSDRRFAIAVLSDAVLLWMLWFRQAGPLGPVSQLLALLRHTVSSQQLVNWSLAMMLSVAAGLLVGLLVRNVRYHRSFRFRWSRVSVRGKCFVLLAVAVMAIGASLLLSSAAYGARQLSLQEICRRERDVDEDQSYVILKNDGLWPNEPKELFLTTDPDEPDQYRAASLTIAPGETARITENADRFLSVRRSGGDTVYLMDAFGEVLDAVELPELPADMAYRRTNEGWQTAAVSDGAEVTIAAPSFSAPGGFYDAAFDLTLQAAPGQKIYYTLDGSAPNSDSELYTAPIHVYDRSGEANRYRSVQNVQEDYLDKAPIGTTPVDKAFVVRAVSMDNEGKYSETATQSYFINKKDDYPGLVLSLTADPEDLFGPDGIYVTGEAYDAWYAEKREAEAEGKPFDTEAPLPNYLRRGAERERAADLEAFQDGTPLLNQRVGIRIHGNNSRNNVLKRLSIYSRAMYSGSGTFDQPLLGSQNTHAVVLHEGLDNAISYAAAAGRDVASPDMVKAHVFLNGEFWYDIDLQEKYTRTFFSKHYYVNKENVEFITIGTWKSVSEEKQKTYTELLSLAENSDLSKPEKYEAFCSVVDVQSYIDYACIRAYLGDADSHEHLNTCIWRTKINEYSPFGDGRWRWALYDMDLLRRANRSETTATDAAINSFTAKRSEDWPSLLEDSVLYQSLRENAQFNAQFVRTFMDLVNTTFSEERMGQILASFGTDLSYDDYFFRDRPTYMIPYLAEEFGLTGKVETVTLETNEPLAGTVMLNTITPDLSSGPWTGRYFTDFPLLLTAQPAQGRSFDHWEVDGETVSTETLELTLKEGETTVRAIFR